MSKLTALVLTIALALAASLPTYGHTPNKYKGIDRQSRIAQQRELRQVRQYAARQQRAERKLNRSQRTRNMYKPQHR